LKFQDNKQIIHLLSLTIGGLWVLLSFSSLLLTIYQLDHSIIDLNLKWAIIKRNVDAVGLAVGLGYLMFYYFYRKKGWLFPPWVFAIIFIVVSVALTLNSFLSGIFTYSHLVAFMLLYSFIRFFLNHELSFIVYFISIAIYSSICITTYIGKIPHAPYYSKTLFLHEYVEPNYMITVYFTFIICWTICFLGSVSIFRKKGV